MKRKIVMVLMATTLMTTSVFASDVDSGQFEADSNKGYSTTSVYLSTEEWTPVYTVSHDAYMPTIINSYADQYGEPQGAIDVKVTEGYGSDGDVIEEQYNISAGDSMSIVAPPVSDFVYTVSIKASDVAGEHYLASNDLDQIVPGIQSKEVTFGTPSEYIEIYRGTMTNMKSIIWNGANNSYPLTVVITDNDGNLVSSQTLQPGESTNIIVFPDVSNEYVISVLGVAGETYTINYQVGY